MRFTERELTIGVQSAAKLAFASSQGRKGRKDPDAAWQELTPYQRYQLLEPVGSQVLPTLIALPDIEVAPGTRPTFSLTQITAAVEETMGEEAGRLRRKVAVAGRVALVKAALDGMPPREDPDNFQVPDHL